IGWSQEDGQAAVHPQVERMTRLMDLPHPLACLAVSRITMHLNWLFVVAQDWTVLHLLPRLDDAADRDMQDAALAGLLRQHHLPEFALFIRLKPLLTSRLDDPRLPAEQQDGIAQLILHGWLEREAAERWVSSEELRDVLIHSGEGIRIRALRSLADWSERSKETADDVPEFLTAVWPRQLAVRTPAASAALADLALRSGENMPQVSQAVVPFLETTAEHVEALPRFRRADDEILARFPREHLDILFAILPEDPALWPWGMDVLMERFASLPELKSDPRLSELRRRVARS
ncbi:MAG: hypothetical protein ABIV36_01930, partial [Sphingobium limneticum]